MFRRLVHSRVSTLPARLPTGFARRHQQQQSQLSTGALETFLSVAVKAQVIYVQRTIHLPKNMQNILFIHLRAEPTTQSFYCPGEWQQPTLPSEKKKIVMKIVGKFIVKRNFDLMYGHKDASNRLPGNNENSTIRQQMCCFYSRDVQSGSRRHCRLKKRNPIKTKTADTLKSRQSCAPKFRPSPPASAKPRPYHNVAT